MKKILFSMAFVAGLVAMNAQTVLFEDDFESYTDFAIDDIGDWIVVDLDGSGTYSGGGGTFPNQFDPKAFMVFNPFTAGVTNSDGTGGEEYRNFDALSGEKYMGAWASAEAANDDWMISPPIALGSTGNELKFFAKSMSDTYGLEEVQWHVYVGSDVPSPSDFTNLGIENPDATEWLPITESLDAYAGQTVRIGIQCSSNDVYMLMIDDFSVTTESMGLSELNVNANSVYPNPVVDSFKINLSDSYNLSNLKVNVVDMTGKVVKTFVGAASYDISDLAAGVYVLKINDGKYTITKKLVKK